MNVNKLIASIRESILAQNLLNRLYAHSWIKCICISLIGICHSNCNFVTTRHKFIRNLSHEDRCPRSLGQPHDNI